MSVKQERCVLPTFAKNLAESVEAGQRFHQLREYAREFQGKIREMIVDVSPEKRWKFMLATSSAVLLSLVVIELAHRKTDNLPGALEVVNSIGGFPLIVGCLDCRSELGAAEAVMKDIVQDTESTAYNLRARTAKTLRDTADKISPPKD